MIIKEASFEPVLREDLNRSDSVHVSSIVRDIGLTMGYLKPEFADSKPDWTRMALGTAWEDYVFPNYHPDVIYHPGEVQYKGIAMTIDGVSWVENGRKARIHECKLTWKSMNRARDLQGEWLWLGQTMSYCVAWDTNIARYHIYWVNGNYKFQGPDSGPHYKIYDLEFTARELKDHMSMVVNRGVSNHGLIV